MRRMLGTVALAAALATATVTSAAADAPANPQCWGVVTSQRAVALGGIGAHASDQEEPRAGLGNLARTLSAITGGSHVSDLGSALAALDEIDATSCP